MDLEKDALEYIVEQLKAKATIKQLIYRNLKEVFEQMREEGRRIIGDLEDRITGIDTSVVVGYEESGDFEFSLNFGGDTLVFYMQSNIITFKEDYPLMQSPYVLESPFRKYFGHITVYNFLSDSIRYNRLDDQGYLIARLLVNSEKHFLVEGSGQLNFLFQDLASNVISNDWLRLIIEKAIAEAMDKDLIGPKYPEIRSITLKQKIGQQLAAIRGQKIGFQLNTDNQVEG